MKKDEENDWMEHISCPFCGIHIVDYYDGAELPEAEKENQYEYEQGEFDSMSGNCKHLVLITDGMGSVERRGRWSDKIIEKLGKELIKRGMIVDADEEDPDCYEFQDLEAEVLEGVGNNSEKDIKSILGNKYEVKFDGGYYVERFLGVHSGGPTYDLLFIRKMTDIKK